METTQLTEAAKDFLEMLPLRVLCGTFHFRLALDLQDMGYVTITERKVYRHRVSYQVTKKS